MALAVGELIRENLLRNPLPPSNTGSGWTENALAVHITLNSIGQTGPAILFLDYLHFYDPNFRQDNNVDKIFRHKFIKLHR